MVRIVAIVVLALFAAVPAAGLAATAPPDPQQSPFQQSPAPSQNTVGEAPVPAPAPAPTTQTADSGSFGARDALLVAAGIAALIGGIWFVIARDAKRVTAGRVRTTDSALGEGRSGSATRASRRSRKLSADERKRRKRGRAH